MSFRFFGAKGVANAAALQGKKIGVSAFGSESGQRGLAGAEALWGWRGEVRVIEAGGTLKRLEALKSGALAATALNEPADTQAQRATACRCWSI